MPGGDRTGPAGNGPMTGRAAGFCAGNGQPGTMNPAAGRGGFFGQRRGGRCGGGFGRGFRNMFLATGLPGWARFGDQPVGGTGPDEKQALRAQVDALEAQLATVRQRMETWEKS